MQPVDFSVLRGCALSPDTPYTSFEELSTEELDDLLEEIGIVDGNAQVCFFFLFIEWERVH